ncbi:MAG: SBBP repeat-containing protein, partial [Promethearchaeota archaeon]
MTRRKDNLKLFFVLLSVCVFMSLNMTVCTGFDVANQLDNPIYKIDMENTNYLSSQVMNSDITNNVRAQTQEDVQLIVEKWIARYNSPGNGIDRATALAVDASGNVYVTGESTVGGTDVDYVTIKYDPAGNEQWIARYDGPGNDDDRANALAVDASGNVYVTGDSHGSGTYFDYATIKYDPAGNEQWIARYNGPGNGYDRATALAVDASGNVYVTGDSKGSGSSLDFADYATIKYDPAGNEQWIVRYNAPGDSRDEATAIAVDASGNVYVTGESTVGWMDADYVTIKYDPAGNEQWVARYNGPGNWNDKATALAVDASGNVYVTGESTVGGTDVDYATIKYDPAGNEQWIARYNGPGNGYDSATALTVDASGNVYVTGYSEGIETASDYVTIRYDPAGNEKWVARYNGPGNWNDEATALAVDASGNVYVTGYSEGIETAYDYVTIKYNRAGNEQWIARYNSPGNGIDSAFALAVDASGNVYVTGESTVGGTDVDYAT